MARTVELKHHLRQSGRVRKACAIASFLPLIACCLIPLPWCSIAFGADKWPGVDESVVEKFASERGREAHEPLINTDQGDLLLFVFLLAGTVGGFAAGYFWRMLLEGKAKNTESLENKRS